MLSNCKLISTLLYRHHILQTGIGRCGIQGFHNGAIFSVLNNKREIENQSSGCHKLFTKQKINAISSRVYSTEIRSAESIDDFRAREEQRERDYQEKQETSETFEQCDEKYEEAKVHKIKERILEAALPLVGESGWTKDTIVKGAEIIGFPGVSHGMFPDGGVELIRYFYTKCNEELIEQMQKELGDLECAKDPVKFSTNAIKNRLQMIEPYIQTWPQALAIMSLPQNATISLAQLLTMIDDIAFYAGDRSVNFEWYTRRLGLATIYKLAEIYMLQDSSMNHIETWDFLEKRMEEASKIQTLITQTDDKTQNIQKLVNSTFILARNMLGLNFNRR